MPLIKSLSEWTAFRQMSFVPDRPAGDLSIKESTGTKEIADFDVVKSGKPMIDILINWLISI